MNPSDVMGHTCRDKISGLSGICVGVVEWMFGCRHYYVKRLEEKDHLEDNIAIVMEPVIEVLPDEPVSDIRFDTDVEAEAKTVFGKTYQDIITGFEGICIGLCCTLYGEYQLYLQPKCKKKTAKPKLESFDKGRLRLVEVAPIVHKEDVVDEHRGGIHVKHRIY